MRAVIIGALAIGFIGLIFFLTTSNSSQPPASEVTMQTIQADVEKGGALLDVRTPEEYTAGHIAGAQNLPLQSIANDTLPETAKDQPIYVYCQSGNRSAQASALLKDAGYSEVTDLGAMSHVQSIGGTISTDPTL